MKRNRLFENRLRGLVHEAVRGVLNEGFINSGDEKFDYLSNQLFDYVEDWGISEQMENNETFQKGRDMLHKALLILKRGFDEYYGNDENGGYESSGEQRDYSGFAGFGG